MALVLALAAMCGSGVHPPAPGRVTGGRWTHVVATGDTWGSLGARFGVAPAVLAARNQTTLRRRLKPGDLLSVDNRHISPDTNGNELLVNLPQRMLFHYAGGQLQGSYPVAVGRPDWPTPTGGFVVIAMETNPTWDVPLSIQSEMRRSGKRVVTRVPPGPANPLGRYWLGLSVGSIGIHGTSAPSSIYQFATHGCIRLHPDDIEQLYARVNVGQTGRLIYEPVLVGWDGTQVFLEVHRDAYRRGGDPAARAWQLLRETGLDELADEDDVERIVLETEGLAVPLRTLEASDRRRAPRD